MDGNNFTSKVKRRLFGHSSEKFPRRLTYPACISFEDSLLTVGGDDSRADLIDEIWMLKNSEWSLSGHLNYVL